MLEKLDLKQKLDKKEYDKKMDYYGCSVNCKGNAARQKCL